MSQEREEIQGYYEMLWDCEFCDTKGLLAKSQRYCANCGGPQNPDKRYFPKEGEQVRVDGHQFEGADRACPACSTPQSARATNCTHCGSVLDGSAEVRAKLDAPAAPAAAVKPARRKRRIWPFVLGAIAILGVVIWFRCVRTQSAQVVVTGHSWQHVIAIEEFADQTTGSWRNEIPPDAGLTVCHDKSRSTRQVEDGEDCHTERRDKKDGTFEQVKKCKPKFRSEPIMDSWCTYTVRRWTPKAELELKTSGTGITPAATWPTGAPPAEVQPIYGAKRQGKRIETLTLQFKDHGSCDVDDKIWRKYTDGQKLKVEVRASGDVACDSL